MKELIVLIAKSLVDSPEEVSVEEIPQADSVVFRLTVSKEDRGKVIGKQGRVIKAIRTLVLANSKSTPKRILIEVN
ncbi:KH domain-containing protein [Risungbinella massiliensis]|uniref:KH domain-containing protein n=1 Tax=Risungbinella massiliensis TaxID=1329796 RepID=UPI0005CBBA12|nr:KH domain-containing protein [Risungbinella massiliensis]